MRDIKFRAIVPERNATIYFDLNDIARPAQRFSIREILVPWLLRGNVPDLYTDKKDKNGKGIYEGDIVKFKDIVIDTGYPDDGTSHIPFSGITDVFFDKGCYYLRRIVLQTFGWASIELCGVESYRIEVIGNIIDNPKLL